MPDLKSQFLLDPEIIFLNHGSFGATPYPVFEAYQRWQRELEFQPVEFLGRQAETLLKESRWALGNYLRTDSENLVYVTNATTGINIVARSLNLGSGDEVISTDHEYGAMDRTWKFLSGQHGFRYRNIELSFPFTNQTTLVDELFNGITPRTRVIFISHITSPTAAIFPIQEICQRAREAGILTVVDGAHAPGQIPLFLDDLGADFYTGNLHKWLCAPKGSAFLYANPEVQYLLQPFVVSWGWESDRPGPSRFIDLLEWQGTRDISPFLSVPDAIRYQEEHDWELIRKDCHNLASHTMRRIVDLTGLPPLYPDSPDWFGQMGSVELPTSLDIEQAKATLYTRYRIEVPLIAFKDKKLIRFSFQAYNTPSDADALVDALTHLIG